MGHLIGDKRLRAQSVDSVGKFLETFLGVVELVESTAKLLEIRQDSDRFEIVLYAATKGNAPALRNKARCVILDAVEQLERVRPDHVRLTQKASRQEGANKIALLVGLVGDAAVDAEDHRDDDVGIVVVTHTATAFYCAIVKGMDKPSLEGVELSPRDEQT